MFQYHLTKPGFKQNVQKKTKSITFFYPSDDIYESSPYLVVLPPVKFTIECWGASTFFEDYAAYVKGTIELTESKAFYIYLGRQLIQFEVLKTNRSIYNGGGAGGYPNGQGCFLGSVEQSDKGGTQDSGYSFFQGESGTYQGTQHPNGYTEAKGSSERPGGGGGWFGGRCSNNGN